MKPLSIEAEVHRLVVKTLQRELCGACHSELIAGVIAPSIAEYVRERIVRAEMETMDVRAS